MPNDLRSHNVHEILKYSKRVIAKMLMLIYSLNLVDLDPQVKTCNKESKLFLITLKRKKKKLINHNNLQFFF